MRAKKYLKRLGLILLITCVVILVTLEVISRGAAQIFNHAMANQDMLRGTITVERLISDITGHVYFTNLVWTDREGNPILEIPSGDFRVNVWDVLTRDFKSTTIRELTVDQPIVSVRLSDDMKVDFVRPSPDMDNLKKEPADWREKVNLSSLDARGRREVGQWRREHRQQKMQNDWRNFNAAGKKLKLRLNVHDGGVEVFYRERHYVMSHVQMAVGIDTNRKMDIDMSIGGFGGTMIGDAISLNGTVDFQQDPEPECSLALVLYQIDPSSLGFGMNIHDKMTLSTYFTGPVSHPIGTGKVEMDELHIPGLDFANVEGNVYYENSLLQFTDVTADVYKGKLAAYGDYDLDAFLQPLRPRLRAPDGVRLAEERPAHARRPRPRDPLRGLGQEHRLVRLFPLRPRPLPPAAVRQPLRQGHGRRRRPALLRRRHQAAGLHHLDRRFPHPARQAAPESNPADGQRRPSTLHLHAGPMSCRLHHKAERS